MQLAMVAADYTPGVLDVLWDPAKLGTRVQTTTTTQLALYTTFYSPLQMLADTPENYAKHPEAFEYLRGMPATWDESRVDAEIGDHVTTARRSGDTWYVGVVTDEHDRTLDEDIPRLAGGDGDVRAATHVALDLDPARGDLDDHPGEPVVGDDQVAAPAEEKDRAAGGVRLAYGGDELVLRRGPDPLLRGAAEPERGVVGQPLGGPLSHVPGPRGASPGPSRRRRSPRG